ncbi:MAG: putative bifunctional diguanylate cyclase/phosphodiesterase [Planctomycetota bacterium]
MRRRAWPSAILGTGVFAGDLLFRDLCLIAGAIFFATGLVRQLSAVRRGDHLRQLTGALARADQDHTATQDLLASIVRSSISGVMILHAIRNESDTIVDFECRLMNKEAEQILGRPAAKLVGDRLLKHVPCLKDQGLFQDAVSVVETKLPLSDERCIKQGDKKSWYQIVASRHGDGVVATFADVSDRKRIEEKLRHAAQHDTLTGTPNRSLFTERLEQCIKRAKRFPDYRFAVLFLDVDRFKIINDSLGHEAGDQLLISISDRLRQNLRSMDTATRMGEGHIPARLGGDEFALLLDGIHDVRDALLVAERLQKALSEPHMVDGHEIISSSSIGIVTSDGDYDRPDEIMRDADTAMYQAKNSGKARHVVFDERMHAEAIERLNLEKELRQAAENQDFDLVYQPIVSLQDSSLAGFEALLRWRHPVRGTVLPEQFVALAEELDLIVPIGHWILRQACEQLARWQEAAPDRPNLTMCINLSRQQFTDAELVPSIRGLIKETGIDPATLMLEITESAVMENADRLAPVLTQLRALGVKLAMDDFGTGHSSLSFLHRVPMNVLKIDQSFITSAVQEKECAAIVRTIVQLARNLGMKAVAEGIETQAQLEILRNVQCEYGQGFLFSEPVDGDSAGRFLTTDHRFDLAA